MNTHTHTDAPWKIEPFAFGRRIVGASGEEVAEVARSLNPDHKANARLIAAAPDLLAALESLAVGLSPASVEMQRENLADLCRVCREIAENALAKVKGGEA
jgi:hypothetical protein